MNNCLKTQLKGVVNNDTLEVLGRIVVRATSSGSVSINFNSLTAQAVTVKSPDGTTLQTINVPIGGSNIEITQDCSSYDYVDYIIPNKYNVSRLVCGVTSPASSDAQYNIVSGSPDYMNNFRIYNMGYTFIDIVNMDSVIIFNTTVGTVVINDITVLSNLSKLTSFVDGSTAKGILKGDLKTLIENWSNKRTESGTLSMELSHTANDLYWGEQSIGRNSDRTLSIAFSATGCVVTKTAGTMPFATATYTKSTNTWSYTV